MKGARRSTGEVPRCRIVWAWLPITGHSTIAVELRGMGYWTFLEAEAGAFVTRSEHLATNLVRANLSPKVVPESSHQVLVVAASTRK